MAIKEEFRYLKDNSDAALAKMKKLIERSIYFFDQGDYQQAIANYADSIVAQAVHFKNKSDWITVHQPFNMELLPEPTASFYAEALYGLYVQLRRVANYYRLNNEPVKEAFFREKLLLITEDLGKYRQYLEIGMLEAHDEMTSELQANKSVVNKYQQEIESLKKKTKKEETDESFLKIRKSLEEISSTDICPIRLDSVPGGCFVATAVYMTSNHPDLDTFRSFRDQKLLVNPLGKLLVSIYYKIGPSLALYIGNQPKMKNFTHQQLTHLAKWMRQQKIIS